MVEMPESTFYHQTCQSSEAEKTYFIYYWYPKKPPVPAWTKSAAFPGLKDQLEDRYGSVFKRYLDETCDLLASNNAVYNLELKSEEPYNVLQETLKASLPDGILVKEEQPGYFRSQWPSEFMDCVTIFSLKPFGVDRAPKITCLGKRKRAGELQPWGAQHWKKAERTPAVPDKRRNLRSANKYWRCVSHSSLYHNLLIADHLVPVRYAAML